MGSLQDFAPQVILLGTSKGLCCPENPARGVSGRYNLRGLTLFTEYLCLQINIDGLSFAKTARCQFRPILSRFLNCGYGCPFSVGVFYGQSKPQDPNLLMWSYIDGIISVLEPDIILNGRKAPVKLTEVICDAPTKAYTRALQIPSQDSSRVWTGSKRFRPVQTGPVPLASSASS